MALSQKDLENIAAMIAMSQQQDTAGEEETPAKQKGRKSSRKPETVAKLAAITVPETYKETAGNGRVWAVAKVKSGNGNPRTRRASREMIEAYAAEIGLDVDAKTLTEYFGS
jgi:hypothetical protein